ncbi:MAG TPA: hypothetical protein VF732_00695 [Nitrospira sp.]
MSFPFSRLVIAIPMLLASLSSYQTVSASSPVERIALQFKGRCNAQQRDIRALPSTLPGVLAIDLSSVPGHALIDIDTGMLSPQDVVEAVRRLKQDDDACLVEPMQSCISANPFGHVDRPSAIHTGMGH